MDAIEQISKANLAKAFQIIEELRVQEIWKSLDSTNRHL